MSNRAMTLLPGEAAACVDTRVNAKDARRRTTIGMSEGETSRRLSGVCPERDSAAV